MIRRIIEAEVEGIQQVCLVTDMFDINGKKVAEPSLAESAVVKITESAWIDIDPRETPIFTIH